MTRSVARNRAAGGRDWVVGDVHGCFCTMRQALRAIDFEHGRDRLFSVCDLIDRGPNSIEAREWLEGGRFKAVVNRAFECLKTSLQSNDWVIYSKAPFAGAANVVAYLGRYTHKTAIGNHRLVDFDGEDVRFRWRDYAHGNKRKVMRLDAGEFVRRFLLHVLPRRFTRLRHYGVLANRGRARNLALCRALLDQPAAEPREPETSQAMMLRLTGIDITVCRHCGVGTLSRILILAPQFRAAMPVSRGRPP